MFSSKTSSKLYPREKARRDLLKRNKHILSPEILKYYVGENLSYFFGLFKEKSQEKGKDVHCSIVTFYRHLTKGRIVAEP